MTLVRVSGEDIKVIILIIMIELTPSLHKKSMKEEHIQKRSSRRTVFVDNLRFPTTNFHHCLLFVPFSIQIHHTSHPTWCKCDVIAQIMNWESSVSVPSGFLFFFTVLMLHWCVACPSPLPAPSTFPSGFGFGSGVLPHCGMKTGRGWWPQRCWKCQRSCRHPL